MNRLKQLRNSRGITQDELGRMLGVQKAAICKYENGRVNMPNSVIMRLVEIFQVSADYLLGTDEVVPLLKSSSAKLSSSSMPHTPAIGVPLVGFVHAGLPMLADENITEYIPVSANEVSSGECFFMQVEGDCMTGITSLKARSFWCGNVLRRTTIASALCVSETRCFCGISSASKAACAHPVQSGIQHHDRFRGRCSNNR